MRTNQKERAENARKFYSIFMDGNCDKAAIVVNRIESSNPNINRCQFVAVPSTLAFMEKPVVIAESVYGITGCFMEMLEYIKEVAVKKSYFDDGFNEWLKENYGFGITYRDGLVFMFKKEHTDEKTRDWIPVSSGNLPDEGKSVQVTYIGYYDKEPYCDEFAYIENGKWHWKDDGEIPKVKITAWRYNETPYQ